MKTTTYGYRADIIGLLWMALGFFLALALGSYHPSDPSLNSIGATLSVQNKCGYLGSFLSDLLYQFFGWGAWLLVLFTFKSSMQAFRRTYYLSSVAKDSAMLLLSIMTVSSLFELHQSISHSPFPGRISSGGVLGRILIQTLSPYLHFMGLFLILWFLVLILLILYTRSSVSTVLIHGIRIARHIGYSSVSYLWYGLWTLWRWFQNSSPSYSGFRLFKLKNIFIFSWVKKKNGSPSSLPSMDDQSTFSHSFLESESDSLSSSKKAVSWTLPSPDLLSSPSTHLKVNKKDIDMDAERLMNKLQQFSISGEITAIRSGPMITLFEFRPEDHVKVARIAHMEDDLMLALKSQSIRIIAPIPGRDVVGIETAHAYRQIVYLKHLIDEPVFWQQLKTLPLVLGRHVDGRAGIADLRQIPHLMVAGSTGSGKSVFIISFLLSLLFRHSPKTLRLLLVDPKQVDLSVFESLPHLLAPPLRESKTALSALHWCLAEMEKRYRSLAEFHVRDLEEFNKRAKQLSATEKQKHQEGIDSEIEQDYYFTPQPYICVVLEEFGDLMSSTERNQIESAVVRLAQMARACGIHLILSMQSPRKDVVTGLIKTNIPGRISFKVSSRVDSRIILDEGGAERLLAKGDMLYLGPGQARAERFHGPFVKEKEVSAVVNFWRKQAPHLEYPLRFDNKGATNKLGHPTVMGPEDETYSQICTYLLQIKEVSASHLQRKYGIGYPRAARLIDRLEEEGLVGPARGSKPREVLINK